MGKGGANKVGRIVSWTIGIVILLLIMLPFALYIPWVQNKAKDIACSYVKNKTGMDLSVGQILIKFPLDISLDDVQLLDEKGDTMLVAKNFTAGVAVKPLFEKKFEIDGAELTDGKYRLTTDDSSMQLTADVKHCKISGADIDLDNNKINVLDGELQGGKVHLSMYPYKKEEKPDTTQSKPWQIQAKHLKLDDIDYTMEMLPTIDNLTAHVDHAELEDGFVDTGAHTVDAKRLTVDGVDAKYIYPPEKWAKQFDAEHPVPPKPEPLFPDTVPWTVRGDSISLTNASATYAVRGAKPGKGLDMDCIEVKDLNFGARDFYNRSDVVSVDLKNLSARERSGLEIKEAHGVAKVNSQDIQLNNFKVKTKNSDIDIDGKADMSVFTGDHAGSFDISTNSSIDLKEVGNAVPELGKSLKGIPSKKPVKVKGKFTGNTRNMSVKDGYVEIPDHAKASMSGNIQNVTDPAKLQANVKVDADIKNSDFAKEFLSKDMRKKLDPPKQMKVKGNVKGNTRNIDINNGYLDIPGHIKTTVNGKVKNLDNPKKIEADVAFDADVKNVDFAKKAFLEPDLQKKINIVPMKVKGRVKYTPSSVGGDVDMRLNSGGTLVGNGSYSLNNGSYTVDATARSFPVKKIVPDVDVNDVTAHVKASGRGFDFLSKNNDINAQVDLDHIDFNGKHYRNLNGNVKLDGNHFDAHLKAKNKGTLDAKGTFDPKSQRYDIDAVAHSFPVNDYVPELGVGNLTARVNARGEKFDFLKKGTKIDATVDLGSVVYNHQEFKDLKGNVYLDGNTFDAHINSSNPNCDVYADASGTINGDHYTIELQGNVRDLDLQALKVLDIPCDGKGNINMQGEFDLKNKRYNADVQLTDLDWNFNGENINSEQADLRFNTTENSISAYLNEQSTYINFNSPHSLDYFTKKIKDCATIAQRQYKEMNLDVNEVCDALPQFDLDVKMGPNGFVQRYLGRYDIDFRDVDLGIKNDSTLWAQGRAHSLSVGDKAIDTLMVSLKEDNKMIAYSGIMKNGKGTWDEMAQVIAGGYAIGSQVNMVVRQENFKHEVGYNFGFTGNLQDSILDINLQPIHPIIAYRKWNLNEDNYLRMDLGLKRLEGDLMLESDSSLITLRTDPLYASNNQNIFANVKNLRIEEWTQLIPSLSSMKGIVDADMKFSFDGHNLEGKGDVSMKDFFYNNMRQGDFIVNTDFTIDPATSSTQLNANLNIDGSDVAVAFGSLNDEMGETPLNLTMNMNRFPLLKVSPFIPGHMVMLTGFANGEMTVSGSLDKPFINGYLVGDSAFLRLPRYGSALKIGDEKIIVNQNTIAFNDYKIYGLNDKPVYLNGNVDFKSLDNIMMDLALKGKDIQFFGSDQRSFSQIFGKGYIDIDGHMTMRNNLTDINANAKLLSGSDITYVMQDEVSTLATSSATKGMVTFVNPNDTAWYNNDIIIGATTSSALNILANIEIEKGAKINAFLQPEGKDRLNIDGEGLLKYSIDFAGKDNLNGSYTISSGTLRYTPPVISQKVFNIIDGSNLTWSGDMLNPTLDLNAINSMRTSVTNENGNGSRLVDFDIKAALKNSLSNMDLKFDLEAKNDAAIESELQTMTEAQRSQAAINLLLYNSYSGSKTTGDFNTTNALFSFLQSQINSWAANNLKGIDVSFGINQYATGERAKTQTSYSYRLSKSLFGDRFKIAVGGEYSTEASSEQNFSDNLISDISFEYLLNPTGTRYLRLFRHKGIESVLEGQITVTGLSFVMKHKIGSFGDLFQWLKKKPKVELPASINTTINSTGFDDNDK